jgi:DNA-binding MarR family transcriptional regulator
MTSLKPRAKTLIDLWIASERLSTRIDHSLAAIHGLGYVDFMVLYQLSLSPDGCMRRIDLANAIGRTASGVTRLLRPLEKIGLVAKLSSEKDARVSLVTLTRSGEDRLNHARVTLNELGMRLTRGTGDSQIDSVADTLATLSDY